MTKRNTPSLKNLRHITQKELTTWIQNKDTSAEVVKNCVVTREDICLIANRSLSKVARICREYQHFFPCHIGYIGRSHVYELKSVIDWMYKNNFLDIDEPKELPPIYGMDNQLAFDFLKTSQQKHYFSGAGKVLASVHLRDENFYVPPHSGLPGYLFSENHTHSLRLEQTSY